MEYGVASYRVWGEVATCVRQLDLYCCGKIGALVLAAVSCIVICNHLCGVVCRTLDGLGGMIQIGYSLRSWLPLGDAVFTSFNTKSESGPATRNRLGVLSSDTLEVGRDSLLLTSLAY